MSKELTDADFSTLDITKMRRVDLVPYYLVLINGMDKYSDKTVEDFNAKIMNKWSVSALDYIKTEAWKRVEVESLNH